MQRAHFSRSPRRTPWPRTLANRPQRVQEARLMARWFGDGLPDPGCRRGRYKAAAYLVTTATITHDRPSVFQDENRKALQAVFEGHVPPGGLQKVLDAGCGHKLPIDVPRRAHLTGIDYSPDTLARNDNADELILGDIQSYPLPRGEFDAVICWWVLEHVPDRAAALANMSSSLRAGGLMVIGIPHVYSMKAMVTKLTPYRFHVWVLKHYFGIWDAGAPGVEPYPTYLNRDLAPGAIKKTLARHGLIPIYSSAYPSGAETALPSGLRKIWRAIAKAARVLTVGRWNPYLDEYVAIFQKVPAEAASTAAVA